MSAINSRHDDSTCRDYHQQNDTDSESRRTNTCSFLPLATLQLMMMVILSAIVRTILRKPVCWKLHRRTLLRVATSNIYHTPVTTVFGVYYRQLTTFHDELNVGPMGRTPYRKPRANTGNWLHAVEQRLAIGQGLSIAFGIRKS